MYKSNRLEQLFAELGYSRENGLFYPHEAELWIHKFPYWISRVLKDVIKPYAFFSLYHQNNTPDTNIFNPVNQPLILFFDFNHEDNNRTVSYEAIANQTFSFSQAPILIINKEDSVTEIWHGYSFEKGNDGIFQKTLERITNITAKDLSLENLINGSIWNKIYKTHLKTKPKVDTYLLNNIITARKILVASKCPPEVANRLIGRLLFTRYLIDRNVVFENQNVLNGTNKEERRKNFNNLISNREDLYAFFYYLNEKFKGDLFPIEEKETNFDSLQYCLNVLQLLFNGSQLFAEMAKNEFNLKSIQQSLFERYDFEVIPVELISNIYENFVGEDKDELTQKISKQKSIKIYYTPAFLVDYVLSQTVVPHINKANRPTCKIFDPSCGSGIFLVESLRKLIEKELEINPQKDKEGHDFISDEKLWDIMQNNIYGADIDENALEIAIFSVYITLLDYKKKPKEIENFQFKSIKNINFFAGEDADFFQDNLFSKVYRHVYGNNPNFYFDFILGNPPWGKVQKSRYVQYIDAKEENRKALKKEVPVAIGDKEISQAFLIRVEDFIPANAPTQCAFIITSKNLYNSSSKNKAWRKYILSTYKINLVLELSSVNTKVAGGKQIFEHANQPTVVLFFEKPKVNETAKDNVIKHITARPNKHFLYFKSIVIEKGDIKEIGQWTLLKGNNDWLWKTLIHGNFSDYELVKRIKRDYNYKISDVLLEFKLAASGGLKIKDDASRISKKEKRNSNNNKSTVESFKDWKYLDADSELKHFYIFPTLKWSDKISFDKVKGSKIGYLPNIKVFKGRKLLFKKGLDIDNGLSVSAAVTEEDMLFTSTVCSIHSTEVLSESSILYNLSGLINSKLYSYLILCLSSSAGVDRSRVNFDEILAMPFIESKEVSSLSKEIQELEEKRFTSFFDFNLFDLDTKIFQKKEELDEIILDLFDLSDSEKSLVRYAHDVSIPVFFRKELRPNQPKIFKALKNTATDIADLKKYINIFYDHFSNKYDNDHRYFLVNVYVASFFIGIDFKIEARNQVEHSDERINFFFNTDLVAMINLIGSISMYEVSKNLYIQQDFRGFNRSSFYIIKPNGAKYWQEANAYADLSEFVRALFSKEVKQKTTQQEA